MKRILLFIAVLLQSPVQAQLPTVFTYADSDSIIANPERGLQKYSITNSSYYTTANYSSISESTLRGWKTGPDKVSIIYRYFLMANYMNSDISQTYLDNIQIDFDRIRNAGLKILVRFSYSNRQEAVPQQPNKAQILAHIAQLAPILEANKDVIVAHQAGFIGTWGEWYYTSSLEFGTDGSISPQQWANRKEIIEAMLAATPVEIPIQVRYPQIKQQMYGTSRLSEETAYENTPNARIGFFNDAFLNIWGDMGTFRISGQNTHPAGSADYTYLTNETQFLPMSGETNGLNAARTQGANAIVEMNNTNWSIINRDYHSSVINGWIASGHFPEMLRRLGYRFVLKSSTFQQNGANMDVTLDLDNVGFARPFMERKTYLVLKHAGSGDETRVEIPTDIRTWEGEVSVTVSVPTSGLADGLHEAYLDLPDTRLDDRADYSIRLANPDIWDKSSGRNKLGVIDITDAALSTPDNTRGDVPQGAVLHSNYPNPFNPSTVIGYTVGSQDLASLHVKLSVHDALGRMVAVLVDETQAAGDYQVQWNAAHLSSGVYMVRLDAAGFSQSIRATLMK